MPDRVLQDVLSLRDIEALAEARMERSAFDYIAGGAGEEITLRENVDAFRRRRLRSRVLVDVTSIDLATTILGQPVGAPIGVAPMAFQHLAHPDAEAATARAATAAGVPWCLSTMSSISLEDAAQAAERTGSPGGFGAPPRWFQLYVHRDRSVSRDLVQRAAGSGYGAIVVTVDLPVPGYRERDVRNRLAYPERFGNFTAPGSVAGRPLLEVIGGFNERALTWDVLAWIRSLSSLPLVVKGVMGGGDAARATQHGAAGVWVSNHGGRQLDRAPASVDVLDEVVAATEGRGEVYLDSGVRRGADVVTALAMGARAVFVGRPLGLALGVAGEEGVRHALALLLAETRTTMALMGVTSVGRLRRRMVEP